MSAATVLDAAMTAAQTGVLERMLADAEARAWSIEVALELREIRLAVQRERVALGHSPDGWEKSLAHRLTGAIRGAVSNSRLAVRTTALGGGRFRVRLPQIAAGYAGLDDEPASDPAARQALENAVGRELTVTDVAVSPADSWYRIVSVQLRQPAQDDRRREAE